MFDFNFIIFFVYYFSGYWVWFVNFNDNVLCLNLIKLWWILKVCNCVWFDKVRVIIIIKMICGNFMIFIFGFLKILWKLFRDD